MGGYSEKSGEGGEGRAGRRAARGTAQGSEGMESHPQIQPFRQPGSPPEAEREVQERAWKRSRGEAARLKERDRDVAERECRVRGEEAAAARRGHRVIRKQAGKTPPHG